MSEAKHVRKQTCHITGREIEFHETVFMVDGKVTCREAYDQLYPRCPYCRTLQDEPVSHMTNCKRCGQSIHVDESQFLFPTTLLSREQAEAVQQFREMLAPLGIKESKYGLYAQQLTAQRGHEPSPEEVIQALWKQAQLSVTPKSETGERPERPDDPMSMTAAPGALHTSQEVTGAELMADLRERSKSKPPSKDDYQIDETERASKPGDEDYNPLKDKALMREFTRRALLLLKEYGIHRKQTEYAHKRLRALLNRDPSMSELIEAATKLCLMNLEDKQVGLVMLSRMARLFYSTGLNPRHVQKERARTQLKIFKSYEVEKVQVETGDYPCKTCLPIEGKEISVTKAMDTMPLPPKSCQHFPDPANPHPFCMCNYSPIDNISIDGFDEMMHDSDFTAFLDSLGDEDNPPL